MSLRLTHSIVVLIACLGVAVVPASAGQRLIGAGKRWSNDDLGVIAAGDEIVLMPGRHRPERLSDLIGTGERPIVIRSLSPDRPAIIEADNEGIRLDGPQHVIIRDIVIDGAKINGITITPPVDYSATADPWNAHVTIENVTVTRTGPEGQRHAIQIVNVNHVRIAKCTIKGWGGAAIDLLRCRDVEITRCRMAGLRDHGQQSGIHVRGGSSNVRISDCALEKTGVFGFFIGGAGNPLLTIAGDWQSAADPGHGSEPEASQVQIRRCVVRGTNCPLRFRATQGCVARNLTLVRPAEVVIAIDIDATADRPVSSSELEFGNNLIVWEPGDLKRLVHTGGGYRAKAIAFDQNLWWSTEDEQQRKVLGKLPEEPRMLQIWNVDPLLDESVKPKARKAKMMGVWAPS